VNVRPNGPSTGGATIDTSAATSLPTATSIVI
jgi:hypothetical protein